MAQNKLKLNCDKTEAISFSYPDPNPTSSLSIGSSLTTIQFSDSVRDLGVILDKDLNMKAHVKMICENTRYQLRRIASIRPFLSHEAAKTLVTSSILSRIDYCNSVLYGCDNTVLEPLQRIQNSAVRIVTRARMRQPTNPLLQNLHARYCHSL